MKKTGRSSGHFDPHDIRNRLNVSETDVVRCRFKHNENKKNRFSVMWGIE